jgi:branched-chain amino acid transport system ATP-binding protein
MGDPILVVEDLSKRFDGFTALSGVNLAIGAGERVGLIGPNGSGKSTLVNCISGVFPASGGRIRFHGEDVTALTPHQRFRRGIARTFQIPKPFASMTVIENVCLPLEYSGSARHRAEDIADRARAILREVDLAAKSREYPENLTQIDLRRLELARAMAVKPKLLIADEVMAGLAGAEVEQTLALLLRLAHSGIAIIMIEHIMRAVMAFSERMVVLVAGSIVAEGRPDDVVRNPIVEQAYLGE